MILTNKNKIVFVGISGGVDSSVAASLLKVQGYKVVGVFIRTWTPDFINCTWRDERRDAMRVCAHLDIPFLECDAEVAYKKSVADYMIEEYKKGRTPNPDVMCNREVKFGVYLDFAKKHGADYIATGHYAICEKINSFREATDVGACPSEELNEGRDKEFREKPLILKQSPDKTKDQSYFLWTLRQEDLAHTLFPVGHLNKTDVRKLAKKYKIPVAEKKDSQGVCFLGPLDMKDFLSHYIESKKGDVINEDGDIIGSHEGSVFYTIGERHGFIITKKTEIDKPYYVVGKDLANNTITVSSSPVGKALLGLRVSLINTNWICNPPEINKFYTCQIRYHGELLKCKINCMGDIKAEVIFDKDILIDKGQSVVFYDGDICIGGGIVE